MAFPALGKGLAFQMYVMDLDTRGGMILQGMLDNFALTTERLRETDMLWYDACNLNPPPKVTAEFEIVGPYQQQFIKPNAFWEALERK